MFHIFKTEYSFNHPLEYIVNDNLDGYFEHPINNTDINKSKICKFGRDGALLIIWYLIIRYLLIKFKLFSRNDLLNINNYILLFIFVVSWMNLNAVIYFIPFLIFDYKTY